MPTPGSGLGVSTLTQIDGLVVSIDERNIATVNTKFGIQIFVPTELVKGKSMTPQIGEHWLFTREISNRWTFAVQLDAPRGPENVDAFDCATTFLFGSI